VLVFCVSPQDKRVTVKLNMESLKMPDNNREIQTYRVGNITFIVTPKYRDGKGETIFSLLLKLMKSDIKGG
jgi:hypothetical protein